MNLTNLLLAGAALAAALSAPAAEEAPPAAPIPIQGNSFLLEEAYNQEAGGVGFQAGLPLSILISKSFVSNTNLGGTVLLNDRSTFGTRATL